MSDSPYDWKLPSIPSDDAVVISRQALQEYGAACWRQGVKRGKYEARNSMTPGQEGLSQQGREGPDTDDHAAPGSTGKYADMVLERAKDDGWIEWNGGKCPVPGGTHIFIKFRDGFEYEVTRSPETYGWVHHGINSDIIAYKVVS